MQNQDTLFEGKIWTAEKIMSVSNNRSHFAHKLAEELEDLFRVEQRFTVSYSPWTNGSSEVTNSVILKCLRTLLSEYCMPEEQFEKLIPLMLCFTNNRKSVDSGLTPNQIFFGVTSSGKNLLNDEKRGRHLEEQFPIQWKKKF